MSDRKPWGRQWSRWISVLSGSKRIDASGIIAVGTTGTHYPMSGYDYRFVRADLHFQVSDIRSIKLSVSSANMAAYIYNVAATRTQHISIEVDNQDWVVKKYDPVMLNIGTIGRSGTVHYKIYTEII